MDGLQRLLDFLAFLREQRIIYRIDQFSDESVSVSFAVPGSRIEVNFYTDHLDISSFGGDEDHQIVSEDRVKEIVRSMR